eukprot:4634718-Pyramimonas_sp.AAC.1
MDARMLGWSVHRTGLAADRLHTQRMAQNVPACTIFVVDVRFMTTFCPGNPCHFARRDVDLPRPYRITKKP